MDHFEYFKTLPLQHEEHVFSLFKNDENIPYEYFKFWRKQTNTFDYSNYLWRTTRLFCWLFLSMRGSGYFLSWELVGEPYGMVHLIIFACLIITKKGRLDWNDHQKKTSSLIPLPISLAISLKTHYLDKYLPITESFNDENRLANKK